MHDIVIRGGTIIDGTGHAAFTGDVAIMGGRIAAVGGKAGTLHFTDLRCGAALRWWLDRSMRSLVIGVCAIPLTSRHPALNLRE
jgi:hypothetical protein